MVPKSHQQDDADGFVPPYIADEKLDKLVAPQAGPRKYRVHWFTLIMLVYAHFLAVHGLYLLITKATWATVVFTCVTFYLSAVSTCAGAHRLWSHRSYKATWPLQVFLMLCYCMGHQYSIFHWARDHRLHHKYSDTDGDPYNASRGFVYSHFGWFCVDRHPEVLNRMKLVDMSDILANPVVMFQKKHEDLMNCIFALILPGVIPILFWNENFDVACHVNMFRLVLNLNGVFSINSIAHMFGPKPYDKNIEPSQNIITTIFTFGEGFHNYHHTFPYDYKAGELGSYLNFSASFIYFCSKLGLAYDLKEVSKNVLEQRMERTGDGSLDKHGIHQFMRDTRTSDIIHPDF